MTTVCILGTGPDGLLAVHAADMAGVKFTLYGSRTSTEILGAQYLREPIPGMTLETALIEHNLDGDLEDYWHKAFGIESNDPLWFNGANVYAEDEAGNLHYSWTEYAWNLRECYERLWTAYKYEIENVGTWTGRIHPESPFVAETLKPFDLVINTWPQPKWAGPEDVFEQRTLWRMTGTEAPIQLKADNTIIYDATKDVGLSRMAKVFGHSTIEWPGGHKPPIDNLASVEVPISLKQGKSGYPGLNLVHLGSLAAWDRNWNPCDSFRAATKLFSAKAADDLANSYPDVWEATEIPSVQPWETNPYAPPKD
jgi:hypothetical protein